MRCRTNNRIIIAIVTLQESGNWEEVTVDWTWPNNKQRQLKKTNHTQDSRALNVADTGNKNLKEDNLPMRTR